MKKWFLCIMFIAAGTVLSLAALPDIEEALMGKDYERVRSLSADILKQTAIQKDRVQAEYYLGLSQLRLGQYAPARKAFLIVMSASATDELYEKAALGLIESLYAEGFYTDALKQGNALLRKVPNSQSRSLIYLKISRAHLKLMHWQEAKENLQKIINEFPQSPEVRIAKDLLEEKEYFTVQVGAFLDKDKAVKLSEEIKAKGMYAFIVETSTIQAQVFYRVRVGQAASLKDAKSLEDQLGTLGYPTRIYP